MLNCHILKYTAPFKVICLTADYPWPCSPIWFQPKVIWIDKLKNKYLSFCRYFSVLYSHWSYLFFLSCQCCNNTESQKAWKDMSVSSCEVVLYSIFLASSQFFFCTEITAFRSTIPSFLFWCWCAKYGLLWSKKFSGLNFNTSCLCKRPDKKWTSLERQL